MRCDAMRCRGDELRPICVAGLLTRMAFLILESPLAIAGIIWQLWNGITLPNLVPFLAPLLFLLIISHQSYFLQKKKQYSISASTREKWAQFSHWAFSLISIVCIIWSI